MNRPSGDTSGIPHGMKQLLEIPFPQLIDLALDRLMDQGEMVARVIENARHQVGGIVGAANVRRIYLAGCGDSYSAALSARHAFEQLTGLSTMACEAMELARYTLLPPDSLVVLISSGGEVNVTLEAGKVARRAGAEVIGVTARRGGRMAQEFPCLFTDPGFSGSEPVDEATFLTGNYSFALAALYVIATRMGLALGQLDDGMVRRIEAEMDEIPGAITQATGCSAAVREYLETVSDGAIFHFVGAGPSFGVARFFQAKFLEQAQRPAYCVELEEFLHEYFFALRPGGDAQVWFIVPPGYSRERALEVMAGCQDANARVIAVAAVHDVQVRERADLVFPVAPKSEVFSPLVCAMPGQLLAMHALAHWGGESFSVSLQERQLTVSRRLTRKETV